MAVKLFDDGVWKNCFTALYFLVNEQVCIHSFETFHCNIQQGAVGHWRACVDETLDDITSLLSDLQTRPGGGKEEFHWALA